MYKFVKGETAMTKKILAILLAAIMVLCAIPFTAVADDEATTAEERVKR